MIVYLQFIVIIMKTDQLAQAIICAIYIPDDRAKNCLRIDVLSVHIPRSMPELCTLETRGCKTAVLRNAHLKIAKLGKVRLLRQSASMECVEFRGAIEREDCRL